MGLQADAESDIDVEDFPPKEGRQPNGQSSPGENLTGRKWRVVTLVVLPEQR